MADVNFRETCSHCKFYGENDIIGTCKRYPETKNKHHNDWCGEFAPNKTTQVLDSIVESVTKEPTPSQPKKAGRPKKVKNET